MAFFDLNLLEGVQVNKSMNRKEFLKALWVKRVKPLLQLVVIYFCIRFLLSVIREDGGARLMTMIVLGLAIMIVTIQLLGRLITPIVKRSYSQLPDSVKVWFRIAGKVINYLSPIVFGIVAYHMWQQDAESAAIIIGIFLLSGIRDIVRKEKQN